MGKFVKITKQALDGDEQPLRKKVENPEGGYKLVPVLEDIVCVELHWGKRAMNFDADGPVFYETIVYLRRVDNGLVEEANPGELVYLDEAPEGYKKV